MKLRLMAFFVGVLTAMAAPMTARAQTLPDMAAATGVAADLNKRAGANGVGALKRAKDKLAPKTQEAFGWDALAGKPAPGGVIAPGLGAAPAQPPAPAPEPWLWRLKGSAIGRKGRLAVFQAPDGSMRYIKVGEKLDKRTRVLSVSVNRVTVKVDDRRMKLMPW